MGGHLKRLRAFNEPRRSGGAPQPGLCSEKPDREAAERAWMARPGPVTAEADERVSRGKDAPTQVRWLGCPNGVWQLRQGSDVSGPKSSG